MRIRGLRVFTSHGAITSIVVILLAFTLTAGCSFEDPINKAIAVLDKAINEMSYANADWETILQESRDQLTDSAQSSIRNEVSNTLNRAVAASSIEFRCDADFIRKRALQDLIRIRAKLKGQSVNPLEPVFCQAVPNNIDLNLEPASRPIIEFDGYDFDATPRPQAFLLQKNGALLDVSQYLSITHHYQMTLNIGGNGVPISDQSEKIHLKWNGTLLSEIPVVQPKCKIKTVDYSPSSFTHQPPHTWGDTDYAGAGPEVSFDAYIKYDANRVYAPIYMRAIETESDWTMADGWATVILYEPPPGWKVIDISPKSDVHHHYIDSNHANDVFWLGSGPIRRLEYVGDTNGDEAGTMTKVTIDWNQFHIKLQQTGNCIP